MGRKIRIKTWLQEAWVIPIVYCLHLRSNPYFFTLQAAFPSLPCKLALRELWPVRDSERIFGCYRMRKARIALFFSPSGAYRQCLHFFLVSSFYNNGFSSASLPDFHLVTCTMNPASSKGPWGSGYTTSPSFLQY